MNTDLYDQIPDTDIRKQWFLSPDSTSSLIDNETIEGSSIVEYFGLEPYVNTKFGAYQSVFGNTTNASDWPLMRVLSPATDRRLGGPLPRQLSNRTRVHLSADCSFDCCPMRNYNLMRY